MSRTVDVAIVGLGPTGAILSALLGRSKIQTVVIDKADDIFPLPRAIAFDHEVMRVVQNIGLADAIEPYVVPYPPTEYHGMGGKLIARYESLPPPYPQGWHPSFMFKQPPFEAALRRSLSDLPTVTVRLQTALEGMKQDEDHVELTLTNSSGAKEILHAQYVVGCDGGSSLVRKLMGIGLQSMNFDEPWLVVDMLVEEGGLRKLPRTLVQYCDPARPTTYVVGAGDHRRWEFMLHPGETAEAMNQEPAIWGLLAPWLTPKDGKIWRAATYVFHAVLATAWSHNRVFLAGDAAHMTPPFMAQGMCQGIRDAANLAWKLEWILEGRSAPALLNSYERERLPHVRTTTETAKALGRIICELDPVTAKERDARLLQERGDPPAVQYRQNLIPGLVEGALCSEQGAPVGTRFPQPRIGCDAGDLLLDDLVGTSLRLVVSAKITPRDIPEVLHRKVVGVGGVAVFLTDAKVSRSLGPGVWSIAEKDGLLEAWMRDHSLLAALVRPDHYVFAVARDLRGLHAMSDQLTNCLHLLARQTSTD